jgi:hypothetical protein
MKDDELKKKIDELDNKASIAFIVGGAAFLGVIYLMLTLNIGPVAYFHLDSKAVTRPAVWYGPTTQGQ